MENATKALLMSAGVLIGMIILALGVYLYSTIGNYVRTSQEEMNNQSIIKFNTQFYNYTSTEEKKEFSFQDIITIANLAYENNVTKELTKELGASAGTDYVEVLVYDVLDPSTNSSANVKLEKKVGDAKQLADLLAKNYYSKYTSQFSEITLNSANRVNKIVFRKVL